MCNTLRTSILGRVSLWHLKFHGLAFHKNIRDIPPFLIPQRNKGTPKDQTHLDVDGLLHRCSEDILAGGMPQGGGIFFHSCFRADQFFLNERSSTHDPIYTYLPGRRSTFQPGGRQHFAKYQEWLASLGEAAVNPANPFINTSPINPDRTISTGSKTLMSGYTVIENESMQKALEITKTCPFLDINSTLEVSELIQM